jgi:hypothetical protein
MKKTKVDLTQEDFEDISVSYTLEQQLISDITGCEEWDTVNSPGWVIELAQRLLNKGWKK